MRKSHSGKKNGQRQERGGGRKKRWRKSANLSLGPGSEPSGLVIWTEEPSLSGEGGTSEYEPGIHTAWGFLGRSLIKAAFQLSTFSDRFSLSRRRRWW